MTPEPVPLPVKPFTAIDTTDGDTAAAILWTSSDEPTISMRVLLRVQLPSVLAYTALVRLSTHTFVGGVSGDTATATPPATTAPITNPLITLVNVDTVFMRQTLSLLPERSFNGNSTFAG